MAKAMYDPWSKIVTKNGYAGDEVISALQKSIRRAKEEDACMFAYEMYISSPQLLEKMWRRLLTISVEDIGMGNIHNINFHLASLSKTALIIHVATAVCSFL